MLVPKRVLNLVIQFFSVLRALKRINAFGHLEILSIQEKQRQY